MMESVIAAFGFLAGVLAAFGYFLGREKRGRESEQRFQQALYHINGLDREIQELEEELEEMDEIEERRKTWLYRWPAP